MENSPEEQGGFHRASRRTFLSTAATLGLLSVVGTRQVRGQGEGVTEKWSFETAGEVVSSPTIVDGVVFVGSTDNNLYALDAETGTEQWRFETGDEVISSPTVADDTVFFASEDQHVYALDAETGEELWQFEAGLQGSGPIITSPTVAQTDEAVDSMVYVGSNDGTLYALGAGTGNITWRFETGDDIPSEPTVTQPDPEEERDPLVFVGSSDGNVYGLDPQTGTESWRFETDDDVCSSPAIEDNLVVVESTEFFDPALEPREKVGTVHARDLETESRRWAVDSDGPNVVPTTTPERVLLAASEYDGDNEYGRIYSVFPQNGHVQWHYETGDWIRSAPTVAGETVVVGGGNTLYGLDADSGEPRWEFDTGDDIESAATVVDGTVFVGSNDGRVYALETEMDDSSEDSRVESGTLGHHGSWGEDATVVRDATFEVEIVETNAPVEAGDTLTVDIEVTNLGGREDRETVEVGEPIFEGQSIGFLVPAESTERETVVFETSPIQAGERQITAIGSERSDVEEVVLIRGSRFEIEIDSVTSPVVQGEDITVTVEVSNTGDSADTQTITVDEVGFDPDSVELTLDGGESVRETLSLDTSPVVPGSYTLEVSSDDDSVSESVRVSTEPSIDTEITATNLPIEPDEELIVEVAIDNDGDTEVTESVDISVGDLTTESVTSSVEGGESMSESVSLDISDLEQGETTIEASGGTTSSEKSIIFDGTVVESASTDSSDGSTQLASELDSETLMLLGGAAGLGMTALAGVVLYRYVGGEDDSDRSSTLSGSPGQTPSQPAPASDESSTESPDADTAGESDKEDGTDSADETESQVENSVSAELIERGESLSVTVPALSEIAFLSTRGPLAWYTAGYEEATERVRVITLAPAIEADDSVVAAFQKTLQAWKNGSSHPSVCTVYDSGTEPYPWIVTESPEGEQLQDCMDTLSTKELVNLLVDTAEAVRNVGLYNKYHLNLSPACVWVSGNGDSISTVVDDWGLERAVYEAQGEKHVTSYSAPEQFEGTVGKRTDTYGLAAVAYHGLTGTPPVESSVELILSGDIDPPSEVGNVPTALDDEFLRALHTEQAHRHASPLNFALEVETVLEQHLE